MPSGTSDHDQQTSSGELALTFLRDRFVFDQATGEFYLLSTEGAWILRAILSGQSDAEIEIGLMDRFGVTRGTAMRDYEQFRLKLLRLGLISEPKEH